MSYAQRKNLTEMSLEEVQVYHRAVADLAVSMTTTWNLAHKEVLTQPEEGARFFPVHTEAVRNAVEAAKAAIDAEIATILAHREMLREADASPASA